LLFLPIGMANVSKENASEKQATGFERSYSPIDLAARKIASPKLRALLMELYKREVQASREPALQTAKRLNAIFAKIGESETIERSLIGSMDSLRASLTYEFLEHLVEQATEKRSWLESKEDWFGSLGEDRRLQAQGFEQVEAQIANGIIGGLYKACKGIVTSIPELIKLVCKIASPTARAKMWELYKAYLGWVFKLHFGSMDEKAEAVKQLASIVETIWNVISSELVGEWEKAEEEGREIELVSRWTTQGVFEIATFAIAALKGPAAVKKAANMARAAELGKSGELLAAASKAEKLAEVATEAKTVATTAAKTMGEVAKPAAKAARVLSKADVLEAIGPLAQKLYEKANPRVQTAFMRSMKKFLPSNSKRGRHAIQGWDAFKISDKRREMIVKRMLDTLNKIDRGEGVEVYALIRKGKTDGSTEVIDQALQKGLKGDMFRSYVGRRNNGDRFQAGRYVSVGESNTPRFELSPDDGHVSKAVVMVKAKFQPSARLKHNFYLVPSVRRPGYGVNIVDKSLRDTKVFRDIKVIDLHRGVKIK
jgi:hypothetical protein